MATSPATTQSPVVAFPTPPRMTGNVSADMSAFSDYVWTLFRAMILEQGVVQSSNLPSNITDIYQNGFTLPEFYVKNVPPAADNKRAIIYVVDESGGPVPAYSDGVIWRRFPDTAEIVAA